MIELPMRGFLFSKMMEDRYGITIETQEYFNLIDEGLSNEQIIERLVQPEDPTFPTLDCGEAQPEPHKEY